MLLLQSSHLISTATVPSHGPRDAGRRARLLAARRVRPRPRQAPLLQEEEDRGGSGGPRVTVHISIRYLSIYIYLTFQGGRQEETRLDRRQTIYR